MQMKTNTLESAMREDVTDTFGAGADLKDVRGRSQAASDEQHQLDARTALRIYKKAVFWSLFFALSVLMWGYDSQINGGLLAVPQFRQNFGQIENGEAVLPARWQSAFNSASAIGGFCGCIMCGYLAEKIGRRLALVAACILSIAAVFVQFFANQNGVLLTGKLLNGISLGFYQTVSPAYCSEVSPLVLRGITTSGVSLFIGFGQLMANGLVQACGSRTDAYAYRLPFALQWIFPVVIIAGMPFCPESPWWLVRKGKLLQAERVLRELCDNQLDVTHQLANIVETVRIETEEFQSTSYADCFRGQNWRRTMVATGTFIVQQMCGVIFVLGFSTYFFELSGLSDQKSFALGMGVSSLGIAGNICSWFLVNTAGRRSSYLYGTVVLFFILLIIGILDVVPHYGAKEALSQAVFMLIYNFVYYMTIGAMTYVLFAEVSSQRLRSRTVGLGIVAGNVFGTAFGTAIPYLLNPDEANLRGKCGFVFAGTTILCIVWIWWAVPETKNRTFQEIDLLYERKIAARHFRKTVLDM